MFDIVSAAMYRIYELEDYLPFSESESEVAQSCPTLHDLMDCSLPGSFVHGIFQARGK